LIGLYLAVAALLGAAGVAKLFRPAPAALLFETLGFRWRAHALVRLVAGVEIATAAAAILLGGPLAAAAVASLYATFAVALALLLARGHRQISCGCFGQKSSAISRFHVGVNTFAALLAGAAGLTGVEIGALATHWSLDAGALVASSLLLAYLIYLAMALLPAFLREALRDKRATARQRRQFEISRPAARTTPT
jgi:hypothetical protein